jgi:hypothetical protein
MGTLKFDDGIEIDTSGELRLLELFDGWYVVGEGRLIPVNDEEEGKLFILGVESKNIQNELKRNH